MDNAGETDLGYAKVKRGEMNVHKLHKVPQTSDSHNSTSLGTLALPGLLP